MGGKGSKESLLDKYGGLLTNTEKALINSSFDAIAGSHDANTFTESNLKLFLQSYNVTGINVNKLFTTLSRDGLVPPTSHVTYANFITNISTFIKGSPDQRSQLFIHLLTPPINASKIETLLTSFLNFLLSPDVKLNSTHFPQIHDWPKNDESLKSVVSHMIDSFSAETRPLDKIEIQIWLMSSPLANLIIQSFFKYIFLLPFSSRSEVMSDEEMLLPHKTIHPIIKTDFTSLLLDHTSLLYLHQALPYETRGVVYPLFSSKVHGESFSTFCRQILERGPTLLVIKDTNGHVFGGVANDSWKFNPQFTGGSGCFLFTLHPSFGVYMPTGYNDNYMYLQQMAQTLPNGLGMGGQIGYFGLWLSADFGRGSSKGRPMCSTFGSPVLSSSEDFTIDTIEVWGIGHPQLPDELEEVCYRLTHSMSLERYAFKNLSSSHFNEGTDAVSILDVDKEARALLEIAGKPILSEGLRDEPDD